MTGMFKRFLLVFGSNPLINKHFYPHQVIGVNVMVTLPEGSEITIQGSRIPVETIEGEIIGFDATVRRDSIRQTFLISAVINGRTHLVQIHIKKYQSHAPRYATINLLSSPTTEIRLANIIDVHFDWQAKEPPKPKS